MDKEAVLDAAETALDNIEEQLEVIEKVKPSSFNLNGTTKKQQITIIAVTAVISAAAAGGVVYVVLNKKLKTKYEAIAAQEIEEAKTFYAKLNKVDDEYSLEALSQKYIDEAEDAETENDSESELVEDAITAVQRYSPSKVETPKQTEDELVVVEEKKVVETRNIFTEAHAVDENFDLEEEKRNRVPDKPYVISQEEFLTNEPEYEEMSLTYFEGDDVLVDERDQPIEDTEGLVGNQNLLRFGHGSKDPNVVYIRNDRTDLNIEIMRNKGSFTQTVLGFIEHSDDYTRRTRRIRRDDDG